jgi:hypothetical protein
MTARRIAAAYAVALITTLAGAATAQTLSNPDFSAIGDMRIFARGSQAADSMGTEPVAFSFEELELALDGHLNPYMRASVYLGIHGTGPAVDVEEAYLMVLRGLPLSLQLTAGRYLLDFGRINAQHPHQWAWAERPLMAREFLGPEGARATGLRATTLVALGETAVTLSGSAFNGDALAEGGTFGDEHDEHEHAEGATKIMGSGRVSGFRPLSDVWSFELGVSYLSGAFDAAEGLKTDVAGADLKLRWRPDSYRSLVWIAEAMTGSRDAEPDSTGAITAIDASGFFSSAELQWRKRWSGGGYIDWSESTTVGGATTTAGGAFLAFSPAEETARISLIYRHETSDLADYDDYSVTLQFLWSLGPHKPHAF